MSNSSQRSSQRSSVSSNAPSSVASFSSSHKQVPARIAEDLLRLLRGSVTSNADQQGQTTKSMASVASVKSSISNGFLSNIELSILRSVNPVDVSETEEITVLGQRGIWMNRSEVLGWTGRN